MMQRPIRVITVEREYGSHGAEFAHDLARHLGWRLLDSELVCGAARMAGVDTKTAEKFDERLDPWYYRYGKILWQDPVYAPVPGEDRSFDSARMGELIRQEILDAARQGECVLVGRGAACALIGHPGCFHVFVYATAQAKREWYMRTFPEQAQHADAHLAAFDKRRAAAIKKFYGQDWCARGLYHMLINSCMGSEAMIAAVEGAAGLKAAQSPAG
ncbi:MAG: AAA family ATPase [Acidobacteriota bacterium]